MPSAIALLLSTAVGAGAVLGVIVGFVFSAQRSVGTSVQSHHPWVRFLTRSGDHPMSLSEAIVFLFVMAVWLLAFFALIGAPALAAGLVKIESPSLLLGAYGVLLLSAFASQPIGRRIWWRVS